MADTGFSVVGSSTLGSFKESEAQVADNTQQSNTAVETTNTVVDETGALQDASQAAAATQEHTNTENTNQPEEFGSDYSIPAEQSDSTQSQQQDNTQQQSQNISWKDALKNVDRKEILKELGITDFAAELNEHISKGGKPIDYLNAKAIDWDTVPDADIVLNEMRKDFPDATAAQLKKIFDRKYNQTDLAEEEDKELGELQMKADARKLKAAKIAEQQNYKIPDAVANAAAENPEFKQIQDAIKANQERALATQQYVQNHPATKSLFESKRVAINLGEGQQPFNFRLDNPKIINDMITDGKTSSKFIHTAQGELDVDKLQKIALFTIDPDRFIKDLFNHGKEMGKRALVAEGEYIRKPDRIVNGNNPNQTEAEAWRTTARQGKLGN